MSDALVAVIEHVPAVKTLMMPEAVPTLQTDGVLLAKLTAPVPDPPLSETVLDDPSSNVVDEYVALSETVASLDNADYTS